MQKAVLSNYFKGLAIKRLAAVEIQPDSSNQHEFNGVQCLKELFGSERYTFDARFIYLGEEEDNVSDTGFLTWYDAREQHPTRSEYRCYYSPNAAIEQARESDLLVIGLQSDNSVNVIVARAGYTNESQLQWLFQLSAQQTKPTFTVKQIDKHNDFTLDYTGRGILDKIGIEVETIDDNYLDKMLVKFNNRFPTTKIFSSFARETIPAATTIFDPDIVLMDWMDHEEMLFRTFERHLVSERLQKGFINDVDGFINYSLSVQNRRKSRAGLALENHLEQIFLDSNISYSRKAVTENKAEPDFVFPGIEQYHNLAFSETLLTMLGVKSTCKDRWRQVLVEAARIRHKHLLSLEPGISENQTEEMRANKLTLVIPSPVQPSYKSSQLKYIIDIKTFIELVKQRQNH